MKKLIIVISLLVSYGCSNGSVSGKSDEISAVVSKRDAGGLNRVYDIVTEKGVQCVYVDERGSNIGGLSCNWDAYNEDKSHE